MTEKPYTDADVKLVASTFIAEAKKNPVDAATAPWLGAQTRWLLGPTEHDIARAVLDVLARAGRLKPPTTEAQIRAGAEALVRLRTLAPSLSELDAEDQAFWRRDAVAVLEAAGQPPSDLVDRLAAALTAALGALTADPAGRYHTSGYIPGDVVDGWRALLAEHACPCLPGAPTHRHGEGGYATEQPDWPHQIVFAADGTWDIDVHPPTCPVWQSAGCPVARLARVQVPDWLSLRGPLRGRYECMVNDLGDRFLLGDRVTDGSACCVSESASDDTTMTTPTSTPTEHDHTTGYPTFPADAELVVATSDGPQQWTGATWNAHVTAATKACNGVAERLVICPPSTCTTTCPAREG